MNGQWSLLLAAEAAVSRSGQAGWGSCFFSANLKSSLPALKMLLGDFLGEKLGSSWKEFRGTNEDRKTVGWGVGVSSEPRDDQTLCPSKDSLNRTSLGWGFGGYYSAAISHELRDSRSCKLVLAGAKRFGTQSPVWMLRKPRLG